MSLADLMAADKTAILGNTNELAEALTYTPAGGAPVAITGIVTRNPVGPDGHRRQTASRVVDLHIAASSVALPKRDDKVDVPPERGAVPVTMRVAHVEGRGIGAWLVRATL